MINNIKADELRKMQGREGLILQGCGGDPQEWVDGINDMLTEAGILLDNTKFSDVSVFENEGLTNILFPLYDENIKKKPNGRIFIREDAKCITGAKGVKGYISIEKYALTNKVDLEVLLTDVGNGIYNTAKLIDGRWYLKPQEKCHSYKGMDDYITLSKYTKNNEVDYYALLSDVKRKNNHPVSHPHETRLEERRHHHLFGSARRLRLLKEVYK